MIPEVQLILEKIKDIHEKKNADYSSQDRNYENFERAAVLIAWFKDDKHKAFVNHIATKLARLATLLNTGAQPNNESVEDTFLDLCCYCVLWYGFYKYGNSDYMAKLKAYNEAMTNQSKELPPGMNTKIAGR